VPLDPSKKTGLGSSAALIVSFVASTFTLLGLAKGKDEIHMHSQALNAYVQEKVGSGFDIACSVFGSQTYSRFTNVKELMALVQVLQSMDSDSFAEALNRFLSTFDFKLRSFKGCSLELCLIDVNSGSDTKLMVKQVLDWAKARQSDPDDMFSNDLCHRLN